MAHLGINFLSQRRFNKKYSISLFNIISALCFFLSALKGRERKSKALCHPAKTWQRNLSEQRFFHLQECLKWLHSEDPTGYSWCIGTLFYVKKVGGLEATGKDQCRTRGCLCPVFSCLFHLIFFDSVEYLESDTPFTIDIAGSNSAITSTAGA